MAISESRKVTTTGPLKEDLARDCNNIVYIQAQIH